MVAVTIDHHALVIGHLQGEPGHHQGPGLLAALAGEKGQKPLWLCWEQFGVGRGKVTMLLAPGEEPSPAPTCHYSSWSTLNWSFLSSSTLIWMHPVSHEFFSLLPHRREPHYYAPCC